MSLRAGQLPMAEEACPVDIRMSRSVDRQSLTAKRERHTEKKAIIEMRPSESDGLRDSCPTKSLARLLLLPM